MKRSVLWLTWVRVCIGFQLACLLACLLLLDSKLVVRITRSKFHQLLQLYCYYNNNQTVLTTYISQTTRTGRITLFSDECALIVFWMRTPRPSACLQIRHRQQHSWVEQNGSICESELMGLPGKHRLNTTTQLRSGKIWIELRMCVTLYLDDRCDHAHHKTVATTITAQTITGVQEKYLTLDQDNDRVPLRLLRWKSIERINIIILQYAISSLLRW